MSHTVSIISRPSEADHQTDSQRAAQRPPAGAGTVEYCHSDGLYGHLIPSANRAAVARLEERISVIASRRAA